MIGKPSSADILIIGGGIIGMCAAYFLQQNGRSVTLVEKGTICSGSSHGNAGWIAVSHALPLAVPGVLTQGLRWLFDSDSPFYIKPRLDWQLGHWLWRFQSLATHAHVETAVPHLLNLSRHSLALYKLIVQNEEISCAFSQAGLLYVFLNEKSFKKGLKDAAVLEMHGVKSRVLEGQALHQKEPNLKAEVQYGVFYPEPAHLIPAEFVKQLSQVVEKRGAALCPDTEVLDFDVSGDRITAVSTTRGNFQANEIILAAGAYSAPLAHKLGFRLLMQPAKGYSITVKKPEMCPVQPIELYDHKIAATPMGAHFRFSSIFELAGFDERINGRRIQAARQGITRYLQGLDDLEVTEIWRGYRPATPDSLPYIGRSRRFKNLLIATGNGMLGITQGPIMGQLVAQLAANEKTPFPIEAFNPSRF